MIRPAALKSSDLAHDVSLASGTSASTKPSFTLYEPLVASRLVVAHPPTFVRSEAGTPRTFVKSMVFCEVGSELVRALQLAPLDTCANRHRAGPGREGLAIDAGGRVVLLHDVVVPRLAVDVCERLGRSGARTHRIQRHAISVVRGIDQRAVARDRAIGRPDGIDGAIQPFHRDLVAVDHLERGAAVFIVSIPVPGVAELSLPSRPALPTSRSWCRCR